MKYLFYSVLLYSFLCSPTFVLAQKDYNILDEYPFLTIANDQIETQVFLPDSSKGFYRGSRYEWSGMLWQLNYKNHTYFMYRKSQNPHNPDTAGHGISLAEEFSIGTNKWIPQRFNEAQPGETFMKMGSGNMVKPGDGKPYGFSANYYNADPGKWKIKNGKNWIEFTHELSDPYGFAYKYIKRMELVKGKPVLIISHKLKNTGTKKISADQYCHNFFIMDYRDICPEYEIQLFFPAKFKNDNMKSASLENGVIKITDNLSGGIFSVMDGYSSDIKDNHCIIRNNFTKTSVDIKGDFPLGGFNFYADANSICPEFFINIEIEPGKTKCWSRTYTFTAE